MKSLLTAMSIIALTIALIVATAFSVTAQENNSKAAAKAKAAAAANQQRKSDDLNRQRIEQPASSGLVEGTWQYRALVKQM